MSNLDLPLVYIADWQLAGMEILRRGGDPCVIDEREKPEPSEPEPEDDGGDLG